MCRSQCDDSTIARVEVLCYGVRAPAPTRGSASHPSAGFPFFFSMPTYEYQCHKCHKSFEIVQSMKDPHLTICPESACRMEGEWGQGQVTRQMGTGAGIIFKGSGFYTTDYRSENYKEGAKKDVAPAAAGEKSATGGDKTPATPAAAPAAAPAKKSDPAPAPSPAPKAAKSSE